MGDRAHLFQLGIQRQFPHTHRTLDGLRVIKVPGCVNSMLEFTGQHLVINGASDLLHEIFGKTGDGFHAWSALGFAQLPTGAAVEVEAIFEIKLRSARMCPHVTPGAKLGSPCAGFSDPLAR